MKIPAAEVDNSWGWSPIGRLVSSVKGIRSIRIKETVTKYRFNKGLIAKDSGNVYRALYYFKKVLRFNKRSVDLLNNIGVCYFEICQYRKAYMYFKRAASTAEDPEIILNVMAAALKVGKKSQLCNCYQKLLCQVITEPEILLQAASLLSQAGYLNLGIDMYNYYESIGHHKMKAVRGRGICLAKQGKLAEAEACAEILLDSTEYKKEGWELKGYILDIQNRYKEAVDCYNKAYGFVRS